MIGDTGYIIYRPHCEMRSKVPSLKIIEHSNNNIVLSQAQVLSEHWAEETAPSCTQERIHHTAC